MIINRNDPDCPTFLGGKPWNRSGIQKKYKRTITSTNTINTVENIPKHFILTIVDVLCTTILMASIVALTALTTYLLGA